MQVTVINQFTCRITGENFTPGQVVDLSPFRAGELYAKGKVQISPEVVALASSLIPGVSRFPSGGVVQGPSFELIGANGDTQEFIVPQDLLGKLSQAGLQGFAKAEAKDITQDPTAEGQNTPSADPEKKEPTPAKEKAETNKPAGKKEK